MSVLLKSFWLNGWGPTRPRFEVVPPNKAPVDELLRRARIPVPAVHARLDDSRRKVEVD